MAYDAETTRRERSNPALDPSRWDRIDRILLASCAGIWLLALGAGVAATVALVDLGSSGHGASDGGGTPWLLYAVIGVSAAVIIGAIPLLMRARRAAAGDTATASERPATRPSEPPAEKPGTPVRPRLDAPGAPGAPAAPHAPPRSERTLEAPSPVESAVDQLWVRCAVAIACAVGVAMVAIGVGTYLMAVDSTVAAWVFFVLTAVVTIAMPAVPWFYLKELRGLQDRPAA